MQQPFCTNCGQPLAAGTAFCGNCGAAAAPTGFTQPTPFQPTNPPYVPTSTPYAAQPAKAPRSRGLSWGLGCAGGCLLLFLVFVVGIVGSLVYGIINRQIPYIAIGLGGLALALLAFNLIRHLVRRAFRPQLWGPQAVQAPIGGYRRPREQARPHPAHFGLFFLLLAAAAALFFGLPYYYTNLFTGSWTGSLTTAGAQQGIFLTLGVTVPSILSHEPSGVAATFNQTAAQICNKNGSQDSYQVSGTASNFDVSTIKMTFTNSKTTFTLQGSFHNGMFSLTGTTGTTPMELTMQKGSQADYMTTCKELTLAAWRSVVN